MRTPATLADLAIAIRRRKPQLASVRLVAIDGHGGAGKSTFASRLATALDRAPIVQTDDFASWQNQLDWWEALETAVLGPLSRGETARYPTFDWAPRRLRGWREVAPAEVVILEGVSSGRRAVTDRLGYLIWVEADAHVRLARGLERDGVSARTTWDEWMRQEDAHFAVDHTRDRADLIVDGSGPMVEGNHDELAFMVPTDRTP